LNRLFCFTIFCFADQTKSLKSIVFASAIIVVYSISQIPFFNHQNLKTNMIQPIKTWATKIFGMKSALLALTLSASLVPTFGQRPVQRPTGDRQRIQTPAPPSDVLPLDANVKKGKLPNGLTYYIRKNLLPEKRAELRLVVNTGSIMENDNQRGLAHFVEHMAFNGTKKYKKQELVNYLESIGLDFGADLNASTGFDETIYMLTVPTDKPTLLNNGIDVLKEWAANVTFENEEIDKERGVILEEKRIRGGGGMRILEKRLPSILYGSKYVSRLPIGTEENLKTFPHELVRQFYRDWYRPNLMSVVVVGDIDPVAVERQIRTLFMPLRNPARPRAREVVSIPDHDQTLVSIITDPEAPSRQVSVMYKHPEMAKDTKAAQRRALIVRMYGSMLSKRLSELALGANPPFLGAGAGYGSILGRGKDQFSLSASVADHSLTNALEVLLTEAERVQRFGFLPAEFERQKTDILRAYENAYNERTKTESSSYAGEYVQNFLTGEPSPGIEFEYNLLKEMLPTIKVEEVNSVGQALIVPKNRVFSVIAKEGDGKPLPTEQDLLGIGEKVKSKDIKAYTEQVNDQPLMATIPTAGRITSETKDDKLGVTRVTFSNGLKIVMKPTTYKNDEILFTANSPGGTSLIPNDKLTSAQIGASFIGSSGVANFGPVDMRKKLTGKVASVRPGISTDSEGFNGSAAPKDVETMFQLINLYFTAPRLDPALMAAFPQRFNAQKQVMSSVPQAVFADSIGVVMSQHSPRRRPFGDYILNEMNGDTAMAIYKERFADASDFTFYFVGNFDPNQLKQMAATYLGSLPALNRNESAKDEGIRPPTGVVEMTVKKGVEPKAQTNYIFTGTFDWSRENRLTMNAMAKLLEIRLLEELREALGGTYGVSVNASQDKMPVSSYQVSIDYGSDPTRVQELGTAVFKVINEMKAQGATAENIGKVKEIFKREHETSLQNNRFWMFGLESADENGDDPLNILNGPSAFMDTLTPEKIKAAANLYLNDKNYARFILLPEDKK
jgi:zinc protease